MSASSENRGELVAGLAAGIGVLGLNLSEAQQQNLMAYLDLIQKWNKVYNLTALRDPADMLTHHLLDSLTAIAPLRLHTQGQPIRVLDVGSGTGILAIMAHLLGAKEVEAFDIDDWCVDNGNENFDLNGLTTRMGLGTIRQVNPQGPFDIVLANINKNVLLDEMAIYAGLLLSQGHLLLSGFYTQDIDDLVKAAKPLGLNLIKSSDKDNWASLILQKE